MKLFFTGILSMVCAFSTTFSVVQGKFVVAAIYAIFGIFFWNKLWSQPDNRE